MRWVGVMLVFMCLAYARPAEADQIDRQVRHLRNAGEFKLRLSAALKLAKSHDPRAVAAMSYALLKDSQATVRRVAALSLMKMVDESLSERARESAIRSLKHAARSDRDNRVRANAGRALRQLRALEIRSAKDVKVFVNIGMPADLTRSAPKGTTGDMRTAVRRALRTHAPDFAQTWPSGKLPTTAELVGNGTRGYYVGASVSQLKVRRYRSRAEVMCTVSVRVSPWTGRDGHEKWVADQTASATGNGKVVGNYTRSGIAGAKRDCLLAVVDRITARQVVPFLTRLNP